MHPRRRFDQTARVRAAPLLATGRVQLVLAIPIPLAVTAGFMAIAILSYD